MTPLQEAQIKRHVQLDIQAKGVPATVQELEMLINTWHRVVMGFDAAPAALSRLTSAVNAATASVAKTGQYFRDAHAGVSSLEKAVAHLSTSFGGLGQAAGAILSPINSLAGLVGGDALGFGSALKIGERYNKMLLESSANFNKYGVGAGKMKAAIESLSDKTGLLRAETVKLMQNYERGFNWISLQSGEKLMLNLKNAVGANAEAMQEMLGNLSGIVSKFPDLEDSITRLNDLDKQRLSAQNRLLVLTGQLSLSESKRFQDYINQNKQKEASDKEAKQQAEAQIDAMNQIKKALEDVALAIKDGIIKYVKELADWIQRNKSWILEWVPTIAKVAAGITLAASAARIFGGVLSGIRYTMQGMGGLAQGMGGLMTRMGASGSGGLVSRAGMAMGASPLASAGAIVGGAGAGYGTAKAFDWGYNKITGHEVNKTRGAEGAAAEYGRASLTIGAGAAAGAIIGSVVPVIGTAVGALLGALGGAAVAGYNAVVHWKEVQRINRQESYERNASYQNWASYQKEIANNIDKAFQSAKKYGDQGQGEVLHEMQNTQNLETKAEKQAKENFVKRGKRGANAMVGGAFEKLNEQRNTEIGKIDFEIEKAQKAGEKEAERYFKAVKDARVKAWALSDLEIKESAGGKVDLGVLLGADRAAGNASNEEGAAKAAYDAIRERRQGAAGAESDALVASAMDQKRRDAENSKLGIRLMAEMRAGNFSGAFDSARASDTAMRGMDKYTINSTFRPEDTKERAFMQQAGLGGMLNSQTAGTSSVGRMSAAHQQLAEMIKEQQVLLASKKTEDERIPVRERLATMQSAEAKLAVMLNEADRKRTPILREQDSVQGNLLSALNEQRMVLESQERVYQSQSAILDAIIQKQQSTGKVNLQESAGSVEESVKRLYEWDKKRAEVLATARQSQDEIRKIGEMQVADAEKVVKTLTGIGSGNIDAVLAATDKLGDADKVKVQDALRLIFSQQSEQKKSELDTQVKLNEYTAKHEQLASDELAIRLKAADVFKGQLDMAAELNSRSELAVQLVDNLAVGFTASAQMRMEQARSIDRTIQLMHSQNDELRKQADVLKSEGKNDEALKLQTQILQNENNITREKIKQAQILKTIRDGYFSAINAMTIGSGMIGKFILDQNKNLGIGVKYLGIIRSMSSGGTGAGADSRGAREASGFSGGPGGAFFGPKDRRLYHTFDGGDKLSEEVRGRTGDLYKQASLSMGDSASRFDQATQTFAAAAAALDQSINRLRDPNGQINSGGTGAFGANSGNTGRLYGGALGPPAPVVVALTKAPKHHTGGRVGGPEGSEQVIIAQGGETIGTISDEKGTNSIRGRGGITIQNLEIAFDDLNVMGTKLKERIEKEFARSAGFGLSTSSNRYSSY
jgi:hypothetical protein